MESKTYQYRKITKPLLERKRRARINKCLDNLKDLMIDCMREKGDDNIARLEKADILELTVEHLRNIKRNKTVQIKPNMDKNNNCFRSGYIHAANEVSRALSTFSRVNIELGTTLMTHLGHRLNEIQEHEIILNKNNNIGLAIKRESSSSSSASLSVYCDSFSENFNQHSRTMISPSQSSGYGSDSEISSISLRNQHLDEVANVWRPW